MYFENEASVAKICSGPMTTTVHFWNVAPGLRTVTAFKDGQQIAEERVVVKADAVTFMNWFAPRSGP